MPIPRNMIRKLASSNTVYTQGMQYLSAAAVNEIEIQESDFIGLYYVSASVAAGSNCYHPSVELDDGAQTVNRFQCDCPDAEKEGACRHVVGLLLAVENRFFNQNVSRRQPAEETESKEQKRYGAAKDLIHAYASKIVRKTLAEQDYGEVILLPVLDVSCSFSPQVSFRFGRDRMYVVKDLSAFREDILEGNVREYGKYFSFLHDEANFCEESKPFLNFFMAHYDGGRTHGASSGEVKQMHLTPHLLDELIELHGDMPLTTPDGKLTIVRRNPEFQLYLKKSADAYIMKLSGSDFQILKGLRKIYILREEQLFVCEEAYTSACFELLSALNRKGQISVKESDMQAFYNNVLSHVSKYISIRSSEDLEQFVPEPLSSQIYFDVGRDGTIYAELKFVYGEEIYNAYDTERDLKTVGNLREELLMKTVLERYMQGVDMVNRRAYIDHDDEKTYHLLSNGMAALKTYAEIFATDRFRNIRIRSNPGIGVGVRLESDLLKLDISMQGMERQELAAILESYRQRKKYHRLKDGSFLNLQEGSLSEFAVLSEGLHIGPKELAQEEITVPKYRALYLDNALKGSAHLQYERGAQFKEMVMSIREFADTQYSVPQQLKPILRNYQKNGYRWLKTLLHYGFCGILADDMGLGKTLEVLSLLLSEKESRGSLKTLVVCPSSLVLNWENEAKKFAPTLSTIAVIGSAEERAEKIARSDAYDMTITSYELLKRDLEAYRDTVFDFEIVDEAQYIKNFRTQNAKAVKAVTAKNRLALTGTPIENSLAELWSIFDFLMPDFLFSYSHFKKFYETPVVKEKEQAALEELRKMVSPFILRRLKKDVLKELPEKTETVIYSRFDDEQEKIYAANIAEMREELERDMQDGELSKNHFHILAMLTRLRQICCHPELVYDNYHGGSAKCETCMELIETSMESGHKMLVFSQFTSMLEILQRELTARKIPFYLLEGSTKQEDRLRWVEQFNTDNTPVFLISLKAGGTGLNLTGADVVIHYDPWWNLSVQNQASDRAYRIGQKNNVQVFKLITRESIEEKILRLQERKAELADSIIKEGEQLLSGMNREEILKLFE